MATLHCITKTASLLPPPPPPLTQSFTDTETAVYPAVASWAPSYLESLMCVNKRIAHRGKTKYQHEDTQEEKLKCMGGSPRRGVACARVTEDAKKRGTDQRAVNATGMGRVGAAQTSGQTWRKRRQRNGVTTKKARNPCRGRGRDRKLNLPRLAGYQIFVFRAPHTYTPLTSLSPSHSFPHSPTPLRIRSLAGTQVQANTWNILCVRCIVVARARL